MVDSHRTLVSESFQLMALESPAAFLSFAAALGDHSVRIALDDEQFGIRALPIPMVTDAPSVPDVDIQVSSSVVVDVIDARMTLAEAVMADRVRAKGSLASITTAFDALVAWVHAAIRSPSIPDLRPRFDSVRGAK